MMPIALALSPGGHLFVEPDEQAEPQLSQTAATRLSEGFSASSARGLELLAGEFLHQPMPATFVFWRGLARRFFTALCHNPNLENAATLSIAPPPEAEWSAVAETAPPMKGLAHQCQPGCNALSLQTLVDQGQLLQPFVPAEALLFHIVLLLMLVVGR